MAKTRPEDDFIKINETYQALIELESTHHNIIRDKALIGENTAQEWIDILHPLSKYDEMRDEMVRTMRGASWRTYGQGFVFIGIFISFFAMLILTVTGLIEFPFWAFLAMIGGFLLIYLVFRFSPRGQLYARFNRKFKDSQRLDFPNVFRSFLMPLMYILKEESYPGSPIDLNLNLQARQFREGEDVLNHNFRTSSGYKYLGTEYAEHSVLEIRSLLWDGSRLDYSLGERSRKRNFIRHRSRNGKYKVKRKSKVKSKINHQVKLAFPKKHYILKESRSPDLNNPNWLFQESEKRFLFKIKASKSKKSFLGSDYVPDLKFLLNLVGQAYQVLEPKR